MTRGEIFRGNSLIQISNEKELYNIIASFHISCFNRFSHFMDGDVSISQTGVNS